MPLQRNTNTSRTPAGQELLENDPEKTEWPRGSTVKGPLTMQHIIGLVGFIGCLPMPFCPAVRVRVSLRP